MLREIKQSCCADVTDYFPKMMHGYAEFHLNESPLGDSSKQEVNSQEWKEEKKKRNKMQQEHDSVRRKKRSKKS